MTADSADSTAGYGHIRETVGLLDFSSRGILHLAGAEGADFLQGLVTNDVLKLRDGESCPAAILTPVGKIFAMLEIVRAGADALYLLLQDGSGARVVDFLERYRFNELVEIADLSADMGWLSLQGPAAPAAAGATFGDAQVPGPRGFHSFAFGERTVRIARFDEVGVPGVHVLVRRSGLDTLREVLDRAAAEQGGGPASLDAWHACRVEAGVPWQGAELDESVLPMEAGLRAILDDHKGCYIGQETVARALVQGRTNWNLWGLRLPRDSGVSPGDELRGTVKQRPVVRVRSVVRSPSSPEPLALGFVHREVAQAGPLTVKAEAGEIEVVLERLPFPESGAPGAAPPPRTASNWNPAGVDLRGPAPA
ncbi:MAG: hypothetical protein H0V09_01490 [Gemmatimonadetes bacterium]|nr:hypothetical protein [Gemmatimonadota bacterium]